MYMCVSNDVKYWQKLYIIEYLLYHFCVSTVTLQYLNPFIMCSRSAFKSFFYVTA